jgi:hypothetical protein
VLSALAGVIFSAIIMAIEIDYCNRKTGLDGKILMAIIMAWLDDRQKNRTRGKQTYSRYV